MLDDDAFAPSRSVWRLLLGLLAAAGLVILVLAGGPRQLLALLAAELASVQDLVAHGTTLAALVYVAAYAGLMTLIWIPPWICTFIGGMLFGLWLGAACAILGATLGTLAVFQLARVGIGDLARRAGPFLKKAEAMLHANAFSFVLVLRLVPIMPAAIVSIASGMLRIRPAVFLSATLIGIAPSTLIYASLGVTLGSLAASGTLPTTNMLLEPRVLVPLLGLASLALVPVIYGWLQRRSVE